MIRALYTAASGMLAQQMNLDNIANNLANASTTGFHNRRLQFQDLIYTDDAIEKHGVGGKAVKILQKPFTHESLARGVREALGPVRRT